MSTIRNYKLFLTTSLLLFSLIAVQAKNKIKQIETLEALVQLAAKDGQQIRMKPGVAC